MADRKLSKNSFVGFNVKAVLGRGFGLLLFEAKVWESSGRGGTADGGQAELSERLWHSEAITGAQRLVVTGANA